MNVLLIHDSRTVGLLNGVVLYRLKEREGHTVTVIFSREQTKHATQFWRNFAPTIPLDAYDQIILCSITFDARDPNNCLKQLCRFRDAAKSDLLILSHRWPDGYEEAGFKVLVPPFDIVEQYSNILEPAERELLRLSLIISRQADPALVSGAEATFAEQLSTAIYEDLNGYWSQLIASPSRTLLDLRKNLRTNPADVDPFGKLEARKQGYLRFIIHPNFRGHAEKTIAILLAKHNAEPNQLGIGVMHTSEGVRAYLVRKWSDKQYPSVEYLLERHALEHDLPKADNWMGPQDAKSLVFAECGMGVGDLPTLLPKLESFATACHAERHGERRPVAGLIKMLNEAATDALELLDICGEYTRGNRSLRFDPQQTRILMDTSNRTGKVRHTMILRLIIDTARAAAFLYRAGGYNFMKLERLLEGVLIGIGQQSSAWLHCTSVPRRLRIDTLMTSEAIEMLSQAFSKTKDTSVISVQEAINCRLLAAGSSIERALETFRGRGEPNLVVFRESETIGPSVQYALAVRAIATSLSTFKEGRVEILDLFSGSGFSARAIVSKGVEEAWQVICVDSAISPPESESANYTNITWLKADVMEVCKPGGLLSKKFDCICMDPPHSSLLEMLFRPTFGDLTIVARAQKIAPWLIVYQGHASQSGRAQLLSKSLAECFERTQVWQIGPEVITVAGPDKWNSIAFDKVIERAEHNLREDASDFAWTVEQRQMTS